MITAMMRAVDWSASTKRSEAWRTRVLVGYEQSPAMIPAWLPESYRCYREIVLDPKYPCYFGSVAERDGGIYYSFVAGWDISQLPKTLSTFVAIAKSRANERCNLVVFFEPDGTLAAHDDFRSRFWHILESLASRDPRPELAPGLDPDDHRWEFTFEGNGFFVVGASPTYRQRRSRNLGAGMVMLFQPREVFYASSGAPISDAARQLVRDRGKAWEGVESHPDLGVYPTPENREWKQYVISDDSTPETRKCPFHRVMGKIRGIRHQKSSEGGGES
jgi:FPC/CPF motif-containing protein YcgG